jgi:hypothetical protein
MTTPKHAIPPSALRLFFKEYDQVRAEEDKKNARLKKIAIHKQEELVPVKSFLKSLTTLGVQFKDGRLFQFYEKESSPTWQPGASLFFDYPALIEIAIPNNPKKDGAIAIRVAQEDKDSTVLQQKFETVLAGLEALAGYLGKHTYQLELDPRNREEAMKKIQHKKQIAEIAVSTTDGSEGRKPMPLPTAASSNESPKLLGTGVEVTDVHPVEVHPDLPEEGGS